jgi:hypothetical protein
MGLAVYALALDWLPQGGWAQFSTSCRAFEKKTELSKLSIKILSANFQKSLKNVSELSKIMLLSGNFQKYLRNVCEIPKILKKKTRKLYKISRNYIRNFFFQEIVASLFQSCCPMSHFYLCRNHPIPYLAKVMCVFSIIRLKKECLVARTSSHRHK